MFFSPTFFNNFSSRAINNKNLVYQYYKYIVFPNFFSFLFQIKPVFPVKMPPKASGRGRKKVVQEKTVKVAENNIKSYFSPSKNKHEADKTETVLNGKTEEDNEKTEEIVDKPSVKQGRKRGKLNVAENIDNTEKDSADSNSLPTNNVATVPKRGRKNLKEEVSEQTESNLKDSKEQMIVNGDDLVTLNAEKPVEDAEKVEDKSSTKEDVTYVVKTKVTGKRGRKKKEEVNGQTESNLKEVNKEQMIVGENDLEIKKPIESTEEIEDKSSNKEAESSEVKAKGKRGRKKNTVPNSNEDKTSESSANKPESVEKSKADTEESKNEQEEVNTIPVKAGRKRKNVNVVPQKKETKRNKTADTIDDDRILKVSLKRSKSIDELVSGENDKIKEKSKDEAKKPASKGKRANAVDIGSSDNSTKPAKKPKEETKSKGQSKKDKMPDVTILDFSNTSTSPAGKAWNMKLASWNVNGVRAWLEKDGLIYLKHESPDIMCIQETKCSDDKLPAEVNVEGYHSYWLAGDKDGYSGVGLLSKKKPLSVKYGIDIKEHDSEGRVITAEYDEFFLISAYVPNAGRGLVRLDYRMQWDKDFCSYIKSLDEKKPIILCGDLNVAHEEIDLANPKTNKKNAGFTKEERDGFSTLLSEGFIDSFRHLYPDQKAAYTFWTYMMNARAKNVGWRLDYFVVSKRFVDNLCDSVIRKDVFGSDHCPIALFISI